MSFEQKEWKNRLSENPTRRLLTPTDGGTAMTVDVTRAEGTVMQQGDPFNADNMNDLERRIAEGIGGGEDIIAPSEQEISENAYIVGDKLIFDGTLYKVISAIAVGNTLVPGVNIEVTTVTDLIDDVEDEFADEFTANGIRLYMDYKNGKYGYNTSPNRGADTFHPFRDLSLQTGGMIISSEQTTKTFTVPAGTYMLEGTATCIEAGAWRATSSVVVNGVTRISCVPTEDTRGVVATTTVQVADNSTISISAHQDGPPYGTAAAGFYRIGD